MYMDSEKREELENRILAEDDGAARWEIFKALADKQRSKKHSFYFEEVMRFDSNSPNLTSE